MNTGLMATILNTSSTTNANVLRDIKPPVPIRSPWEWLWWALGALVLVVAALLIARMLKKRRLNIPVVPPIPAHVRARQKLDEALRLLSQPKPFCTLVSDTLRLYLEEQFNFHAPERTTEEFLHELRATSLLLPDQKESLGDFLKRCDLVKFARYEPAEPELRELHASALRLVDETEPQPSPAPAPPGTAEPQNPTVESKS